MKSKKSKITNKNKNNKKSLKKQKGGSNNPNNNMNEKMYKEMSQTLADIEEIDEFYIVNIFLKNFVNYEEYTLLYLFEIIESFLDTNILLTNFKFIILTNINLQNPENVYENIYKIISEQNKSHNILIYIINENSILILITGDNKIDVNINFNTYLLNNKIHIINNELIDRYYVQIYTELINFYQRLLDICNKIKKTIRDTYVESNIEVYSLNFKIYQYVESMLENKNVNVNVNETDNHNRDFVRKYNEISQSTWDWFLPSPEIQQLINYTNNSSAKSPAVKLPAVNSAPAKSAPAKSAAIPNNSSSICKLINDYDEMIKK
jgi:hypothetical protein